MTDSVLVGGAGLCTRVAVGSRPFAPRFVRRVVREVCAGSALPSRTIDDAVLVASELVTDRLKQTRTVLDVTVEAGRCGVTIRVRDRDTVPSTPVRGGSPRCREIVHRLASSWGYSHGQHGWAAWASLRPPATWVPLVDAVPEDLRSYRGRTCRRTLRVPGNPAAAPGADLGNRSGLVDHT